MRYASSHQTTAAWKSKVFSSEDAVNVLKTHLVEKGLKFTQQRRLVTEIFYDPKFRDHHPTAEELYLRVRQLDNRIGYATVYRTLKLLKECGLAAPSRLGDNLMRYEPEIPGEHHDHLVCSECGAIIEFEDHDIETLQENVAQRYGFQLNDHRMVLFGSPGDECAVPHCRR